MATELESHAAKGGRDEEVGEVKTLFEVMLLTVSTSTTSLDHLQNVGRHFEGLQRSYSHEAESIEPVSIHRLMFWCSVDGSMVLICRCLHISTCGFLSTVTWNEQRECLLPLNRSHVVTCFLSVLVVVVLIRTFPLRPTPSTLPRDALRPTSLKISSAQRTAMIPQASSCYCHNHAQD